MVENCEKLASLQGCPSKLEKLTASRTGITSLEGLESTSCKNLVVEKCDKAFKSLGCCKASTEVVAASSAANKWLAAAGLS